MPTKIRRWQPEESGPRAAVFAPSEVTSSPAAEDRDEETEAAEYIQERRFHVASPRHWLRNPGAHWAAGFDAILEGRR